MTAKVRQVLNSNSTAFRRYSKSRESKDYDKCILARNRAKSEVKAAIRCYEKNIADRSRNSSKLFYSYVNSKVKGNSRFPDIIKTNGMNISDNIDKANEFNSVFFAVYSHRKIRLDRDMPSADEQPNSLTLNFAAKYSRI